MTATGATQGPVQEQVERFVLAAHGDFAAVRALLAENPALRDAKWQRFDEAAIEAAAHMGRREIAEHLLAAGAPSNICVAAMLGRTGEVAAFLKDDPGLAHAKGAHGIPVMFHAAYSGKTEIADLLLAHGGGEGLGAALHAAVRPGHEAMVRWLLAHGADPNTPDLEGKTPLQRAEQLGRREFAALLRERGGRE